MSTSLANSSAFSSARRGIIHDHPQFSSWRQLLDSWLTRSETRHQRAALREIADDPHLLRDLGLTREEALDHAGRPFWR
jgi:uncharacterized protein YjiS (DUF1127 family)